MAFSGIFAIQNVDATTPIRYKTIMLILLGANGYVGKAMISVFRHNQIPFISLSRVDLDYYNAERLRRY